MSSLPRAIGIVGHIAFLVVAMGLVVRRRWTLSGFFAAYVAFVLVINPMILWWPAQFFRQWFYLIVQAIFDVLKLGITLEVGWRTFRPFPGARFSGLLMALIIMVLTALAMSAVPLGATWEWELVAGHLFPRAKTGTIWPMAMTLILARWYHVPVHPFHAAVMTSFVLYLGLHSGLTWVLSLGIGSATYGVYRGPIDVLPIVADVVVACYWAHMAWRPDSASVIAHGNTLRKLQTGFSTCG